MVDSWVVLFRFLEAFFRVLDSSGNLTGFSFSLLDSFQGFGININVETESVDVSEELVEFFSLGNVVNNKVFTSFFRSKIDSSNKSFVESNRININLKDILVNLFQSLEYVILELLISLFRIFLLQSRSV